MLLRARVPFTLDGEALVCGPDGIAIFDALHRRGTVSEAMLYVFELLELDGEDLRALPPSDRKKRLVRLLGRRRIGIVLSPHTDEDAAAIFQQACRMGLESSCQKRLSAPYRSGQRYSATLGIDVVVDVAHTHIHQPHPTHMELGTRGDDWAQRWRRSDFKPGQARSLSYVTQGTHPIFRRWRARTPLNLTYAAVGLATRRVTLNIRRSRGTGSANKNPCPNLMPRERTRLR
jgi:ATP dependent DNA ligase domain